jgi:vacuolar protein sorting-associated protein 13A/C
MVRTLARSGPIRAQTVAERSPPINIEDIGEVHFRLGKSGGAQQLVQADSKIEGSIIFVYLCLSKNGWPFLIENESEHVVVFCQTVRVVD